MLEVNVGEGNSKLGGEAKKETCKNFIHLSVLSHVFALGNSTRMAFRETLTSVTREPRVMESISVHSL